jgi:outer membrane protein assembly factor BamC
VGRLLDSVYDTGERDRFRTRIEDVGSGTEIFISHRGLAEVYISQRDGQTAWQTRPGDPTLEAEMLSRVMMSLGATAEQAKAAVAAPVVAAAKARLVQPNGVTLTVDDTFDRAWRRVGLALDRSGFTVEDRDRSQGLYYVRYADASKDRKSNEASWWDRLWSSKTEPTIGRYRVSVRPTGVSGANNCTVAVQNEQGKAELTETAQRIARLLLEDLK